MAAVDKNEEMEETRLNEKEEKERLSESSKFNYEKYDIMDDSAFYARTSYAPPANLMKTLSGCSVLKGFRKLSGPERFAETIETIRFAAESGTEVELDREYSLTDIDRGKALHLGRIRQKYRVMASRSCSTKSLMEIFKPRRSDKSDAFSVKLVEKVLRRNRGNVPEKLVTALSDDGNSICIAVKVVENPAINFPQTSSSSTPNAVQVEAIEEMTEDHKNTSVVTAKNQVVVSPEASPPLMGCLRINTITPDIRCIIDSSDLDNCSLFRHKLVMPTNILDI